jgi:hypothetical protein
VVTFQLKLQPSPHKSCSFTMWWMVTMVLVQSALLTDPLSTTTPPLALPTTTDSIGFKNLCARKKKNNKKEKKSVLNIMRDELNKYQTLTIHLNHKECESLSQIHKPPRPFCSPLVYDMCRGLFGFLFLFYLFIRIYIYTI